MRSGSCKTYTTRDVHLLVVQQHYIQTWCCLVPTSIVIVDLRMTKMGFVFCDIVHYYSSYLHSHSIYSCPSGMLMHALYKHTHQNYYTQRSKWPIRTNVLIFSSYVVIIKPSSVTECIVLVPPSHYRSDKLFTGLLSLLQSWNLVSFSAIHCRSTLMLHVEYSWMTFKWLAVALITLYVSYKANDYRVHCSH